MKPAGRYLYVWLLAVSFTIVAEAQLFGASLSIEDITQERNIEHSDARMIYQVFLGNTSKNFPAYFRPPLSGATSLSMTTEWNRLQAIRAERKAITSLIGRQLRNGLKKGIKKYFEQDRELSTIPAGLVKSASHFGGISKGNKIIPKFKFGSDYVKPTLHIEKPFHINFETDISYHTGDQILEAALSRRLSSQFEFSIKQTNYLEKNQRHDWLFGIAYEF